jgi:voltage-gated potassium channel
MRSQERAQRLEKVFEIPMLVAAALVIPLAVLEETNVGHGWKILAQVLNWTIWTAFVIEAVVMLAVVPDRKHWLRQHPLEVAVVVLTPPFLPGPLQSLRILRLLRLIRLFALWEVVRRTFTLEGLRYAGLATFLILLGGGRAFAAVEKNVSIWDGIWWACVTMATVGYGDIYPHTTGGRVIGIVLMFVGIGFGSLLIAGLAQHFATEKVTQEVKRVEAIEAGVESAERDVLAQLREVRTRLEELERMLERGSSA